MNVEIYTTRRLVVFDLDGTLFDTQPGCDYEDQDSLAERTQPHEVAIERARALAHGARVAYLTGRCGHVRSVTERQIQDAGLPEGPVIMNAAWRGYEHMAQWKGEMLRALGASLYIGDHWADAAAARIAGVAFRHADELRAIEEANA